MSPLQKELAIRASIKSLISDMRSLDAMKQDEPALAPAFNTNIPPRTSNRQPYSARRTNVLPKTPGYGGPTEHPPFNPSLPGRLQRFNIHSFTYDNAVDILNCSKAEMDFRYANRMCATCVARVPLACSPTGNNRRKIHCTDGNTWRYCEGLKRFDDPPRDAYIDKVGRLFENVPRPTRRVRLCAKYYPWIKLFHFPLCLFRIALRAYS